MSVMQCGINHVPVVPYMGGRHRRCVLTGHIFTADSLSVVSYAPVHTAQHATSLSLAGAATSTVEREQLIGHARHENCDIHMLSLI